MAGTGRELSDHDRYMVTIYVSEMECILRINGIYGDYFKEKAMLCISYDINST